MLGVEPLGPGLPGPARGDRGSEPRQAASRRPRAASAAPPGHGHHLGLPPRGGGPASRGPWPPPASGAGALSLPVGREEQPASPPAPSLALKRRLPPLRPPRPIHPPRPPPSRPNPRAALQPPPPQPPPPQRPPQPPLPPPESQRGARTGAQRPERARPAGRRHPATSAPGRRRTRGVAAGARIAQEEAGTASEGGPPTHAVAGQRAPRRQVARGLIQVRSSPPRLREPTSSDLARLYEEPRFELNFGQSLRGPSPVSAYLQSKAFSPPVPAGFGRCWQKGMLVFRSHQPVPLLFHVPNSFIPSSRTH